MDKDEKKIPVNAEAGAFFMPGIIHGREDVISYVYFNPDAVCEGGQFVVQELTAEQICSAYLLTEDSEDRENAFWDWLNNRCQQFLCDNDGKSTAFEDILAVWDKGEALSVADLYEWAREKTEPTQEFTVQYKETLVHEFDVTARTPEEALEYFEAHKSYFDFSAGELTDSASVCVGEDHRPLIQTNRDYIKNRLMNEVEVQLNKVLTALDNDSVGFLPGEKLEIHVSAGSLIYDAMLIDIEAGKCKTLLSNSGVSYWMNQAYPTNEREAGAADEAV